MLAVVMESVVWMVHVPVKKDGVEIVATKKLECVAIVQLEIFWEVDQVMESPLAHALATVVVPLNIVLSTVSVRTDGRVRAART